MKFMVLAAMAVLIRKDAVAGENPKWEEDKVIVCMDPGLDTKAYLAQVTVSGMFAGIGVTIDWRRHPKICPPGDEAIRIRLAGAVPRSYHPGAFAFALPYDGVHIEVFAGRIQDRAAPRRESSLLAHVLAHEIAHILQGFTRHSTAGVMKPAWDEADYTQMAWKPLAFTQEDVRLVHAGLEARAARLLTKTGVQ